MAKNPNSALRLRRWDDWKQRASTKHGGKYAYPDPVADSRGRVLVVCPDHGEFRQLPAKHMHGGGCPACAGKGLPPEHHIAEIAALHPTLDFSSSAYVSALEGIAYTCPEHGPQVGTPNALKAGRGCPACGIARRAEKSTVDASELMARFRAAHGDRYTYDIATFAGSGSLVSITCPDHGRFEQLAADHARGVGCPKCWYSQIGLRKRKPFEMFLRDARAVHGDRYSYSESGYETNKSKISIVCQHHGDFEQTVNDHLGGHGCPACGVATANGYGPSLGEQEVADFLRGLGEVVRTTVRRELTYDELDILLPERQLAVEYNGLYWHGERQKPDPRYHLIKTEEVEHAGGQLIHIFEDEWLLRPEAVKARLLAILGKSVRIGGAREFEVRTITWPVAESFLDIVHLQGAGTPGRWCFGLMHGDEVMACMTIGKARYGRDAQYEILRYASLGSIPGGFSKLLKAWSATQPEGTTLLSYADRRWSQGGVYKSAGFAFAGETGPGYWWCRGSKRFSRHRFQKHKLGEVLQVFDPTLSEVENMHANGFWRVWDCGVSRWIYTT